MNRLKQAWLALCGKLPEVREVVREVVVEKPVLGEPHLVRLYRADVDFALYPPSPLPKWHGNLYLSCEQAHKACGGHRLAKVTEVTAARIGSAYYYATGEELDVEPKPKVAKGRRK